MLNWHAFLFISWLFLYNPSLCLFPVWELVMSWFNSSWIELLIVYNFLASIMPSIISLPSSSPKSIIDKQTLILQASLIKMCSHEHLTLFLTQDDSRIHIHPLRVPKYLSMVGEPIRFYCHKFWENVSHAYANQF